VKLVTPSVSPVATGQLDRNRFLVVTDAVGSACTVEVSKSSGLFVRRFLNLRAAM
jgi:hypothetical protein